MNHNQRFALYTGTGIVIFLLIVYLGWSLYLLSIMHSRQDTITGLILQVSDVTAARRDLVSYLDDQSPSMRQQLLLDNDIFNRDATILFHALPGPLSAQTVTQTHDDYTRVSASLRDFLQEAPPRPNTPLTVTTLIFLTYSAQYTIDLIICVNALLTTVEFDTTVLIQNIIVFVVLCVAVMSAEYIFIIRPIFRERT